MHTHESSSRTLRFFLWFAITLGIAQPAVANDRLWLLPQPHAIQEEVESKYGPIIDVKAREHQKLAAPAIRLFEILQFGFQRALVKHGIQVPVTTELYLIDTFVENAFVGVAQNGRNRAKAMVFVTVGLLRELFTEKGVVRSESDRLAKLIELAGIKAHELAHTVDKLDPNGIEAGRNGFFAKQAIEVRTDIVGSEILRDSGLPKDGLFNFFESHPDFEEGDEKKTVKRVFTEDFISTHPNADVRLAGLRMHLNSSQFSEGDPPPRAIQLVAPGEDYVKLLEPYRGDWVEFEGENAILEIAKALRSMRREHTRTYYMEMGFGMREESKFNHLLLRLDEKLIAKGDKVTAEEWRAVFAFQKDLLGCLQASMQNSGWVYEGKYDRASRPTAFFPRIWTKALLEKIPHFHLLHPKSHAELVPSLPLNQIADYRENLARELLASGQEQVVREFRDVHWNRDLELSGFGFSTWIAQAEQIVPAEKLFSVYGSVVAQVFSDAAERISRKHASGPHVFSQLSADSKTQMEHLLQARWLTYDAQEQQEFVFAFQYGTRIWRILPVKQENHAWPAEATAEQKRIAEQIWKDRGKYAALEMCLTTGYRFDWDWIYAQVGETAATGDAKVRAAFRAVTQGWHSESTPWVRLDKYADKFDRNLARPRWDDGSFYAPLTHDDAFRPLANALRALYPEHLRKAEDDKFQERLKRLRALLGNKKDLTVVQFLDTAFPGNQHGNYLDLLDGLELSAECRKTLYIQLFVERDWRWDFDLNTHREHRGSYRNGMLFGSARMHTGEPVPGETGRDNLIDPALAGRMLAVGAFESASDIVAYTAGRINGDEHFIRVLRLHDLLLAEIDRIQDPKTLFAFLSKVIRDDARNVLDRTSNRTSLDNWARRALGARPHTWNNDTVAEIRRRACDKARGMNLGATEKQLLFEQVTENGPTLDTDAYYREHIAGLLDKLPLAVSEGYLKSRRIVDPQIQVQLLRRVLETELAFAAQSFPPTKEALNALVRRIMELVPSPSIERDRFIEDAMWRLGVEEEAHLEMFEQMKFFSWRKQNPFLINYATVISELAQRQTLAERELLLEFFFKPEGKPIPPSLLRAIDELVEEEVSTRRHVDEHERAEAKYLLRSQVEELARSTTRRERIPLFDLILHSGRPRIANEQGFELRLAQKFLGIEPTSKNGRLLKAYLKVIPRYERSFTLAYLMGHFGPGEKSIRPIFEVFTTVGVKGGQLGTVWKFFDDETTEDLQNLKDHAEPMTKLELRRAINALNLKGGKRVKRILKILGSASIKTVALVELYDGRMVVAAIQRPNAENQVRANMKRARALGQALGEEGFLVEDSLFEPLAEATEEQITEELKFEEEAKKIGLNADAYDAFQKEFAEEFPGVVFRNLRLIPDMPVFQTAFFLDVGTGIPVRQVTDPRILARIRNPIGRASIRSLFRRGILDGDRHGGNFLIDWDKADPENGRIEVQPLDFGQTHRFRRPWIGAEETFYLAQFFRGVRDRDPRHILRWIGPMTKNEKIPKGKRADLRVKLESALAIDSFEDKIAAIVNIFYRAGEGLKSKYSFGALKGLMLIYKEKYLTEDELVQYIGEEAEATLRRHKFTLLLDYLSRSCEKALMGAEEVD